MSPPALNEFEPKAMNEFSTAARRMERERVFSGIYFPDNRSVKITYKKVCILVYFSFVFQETVFEVEVGEGVLLLHAVVVVVKQRVCVIEAVGFA